MKIFVAPRPSVFSRLLLLSAIALLCCLNAQAQRAANRAFVIDDRLAVLRKEPDIQAQVVRRLRIGRPVQIVKSRPQTAKQPGFYQVAVTRRTRGWIHEAAIASPNRAGEDKRVLELITAMDDNFDRVTLCHLFIEKFSSSPLMPQALLLFGEEMDRAAQTLSRNVNRRLKSLPETLPESRRRDYYLSDSGLDRYSRLGVRFEYAGEYVYDGQVYRELLKRFPRSQQAEAARRHLEAAKAKLAQNP